MRLAALKALAVLVSAALAVANFGLIDLADGFTGYVDEARNQMLDAGWGAIFGLVVPIGLLAQLRRPERRIAGRSSPPPLRSRSHPPSSTRSG